MVQLSNMIFFMLGIIKDVAKGIYGIPKIVHAKVSLVDIKYIIITHV